MATKYKPSPFGVAQHPWVNRPDTAFNKSEFKVDLDISAADARKFRDVIDPAVDEAFDLETAEMKKAERDKWEKHYPYDVLTDEQGAETGVVRFKFRQNSEIKLKDGGVKVVQMGVYDSKDEPMHAQIWTGTEMRVMFATRAVKVASAKKIGVRLDFSMVQVKKLVTSGSGGGFGEEVEGGYIEDEEADAQQRAPAGQTDY